MSVERLDQSSDKIRESRRTMMETEDLGVSVLQDLIITSKLLFVAGDLGQTFDSNITLPHYEKSPKKGQAVLFVGDLSYADNHPNHDNNRWDSWGRFAERSTAYQPWIWTTGNHELDFAPEIVKLLAPSMFLALIFKMLLAQSVTWTRQTLRWIVFICNLAGRK